MIKTIKEWNYEHYHYVIGIGAATLIGSIISGIASIGSSVMSNVFNKKATDETNEQNKQLTEKAWERDDMQLQRARQDSEKAGFSPLAALSSNLTNSAPATMQAPSYDFSGVGEGVGQVASGFARSKEVKMQEKMQNAQIAAIHEQNRGTRLDNMLKSSTYRNNVLKNGVETMKLIEEARSQKLSNAQLASILVANGYTEEQAQKLSGLSSVPSHTGESAAEAFTKAQTNLANSQRSLVNAQITDLNSMREYNQELLTAQTRVANVQADTDSKLYHYWHDTLGPTSSSLKFRKLDMETGKLEADYIKTAGRNRFDVMQEYQRKFTELQMDIQKYSSEHHSSMEWMNSIWGNINGSVNAVGGFFMPSFR